MKQRLFSPAEVRNNGSTRARASLPLRILRAILLALAGLHLAYILLTSLLILVYRFANPPGTVLMAYRAIGSGWKIQKPIPVRLKEVPLTVRRMLIAVEDGKFYEHNGIDREAIERARKLNAKLGYPMYGGSTLTMQLARTLFLVPEKTYLRKYLEVIATFELEAILSKDRILELYFGYAEWGRGIFGIERAARVYYGKPLRELGPDAWARLIALLSSPIKYTPETLHRSLILRERYSYLVRRYVQPLAELKTESESQPLGDIDPAQEQPEEASVTDAESPAKTAQEAPAEPAQEPPEAAPQGMPSADRAGDDG